LYVRDKKLSVSFIAFFVRLLVHGGILTTLTQGVYHSAAAASMLNLTLMLKTTQTHVLSSKQMEPLPWLLELKSF
jgi:hypothetical protein